MSEISAAIGDLVSSFTGEQWGRWSALKRHRDELEFQALLDSERDEAREHNRIYLEAQRASQVN
ncbi:hypothetical protein [Corynebacterium callunae]|uniref:hypothetical protein n=1 Tax=Corynebacterium callunae TaxID=1721 RepID=UPI001FFE7459|nr:hypothetical protein [Corynebacterium callunae]MCK2200477.1 hypothetical protein [Corynebacterium callunae]